MRIRVFLRVILLVPIFSGGGLGLVSFADEPEIPPVKPPSNAEGKYDAARTAAERAANERAYAEHVLPRGLGLVHDHLGAWIALAGGRAFPVNEHGTAVAPAATMKQAVAAAEAAVPEARHRFVFRVGEEGDFRQSLGGAELPQVLGVWFLALLERPDVEYRALGPGKPIHFVKDGKRIEITTKGPDRRMFVRPEVGPPEGTARSDALYVLSTGFGGYAVMAADTAAKSDLHLWEVPGTVTIEGVFQGGECRRARARFRFPDTDLDFLVPVAVWPELK